MSVIKAQQATRAARGVPFNFDDLDQQAQQYLAQVRQQAEQLVVQAKAEADAIRSRAEQEGRQRGQQEIHKLVEDQVARQMLTVLPALKTAIQALEQSRHDWLSYWEQRAVHLSAKIAGRVIRRELSRDPQIPLTLVREALELARGNSQVRLLLNPADHQALGPQVELLRKELGRLAQTVVVADPTISPGGCRLETQHGAVDQQIEVQLARIEKELT